MHGHGVGGTYTYKRPIDTPSQSIVSLTLPTLHLPILTSYPRNIALSPSIRFSPRPERRSTTVCFTTAFGKEKESKPSGTSSEKRTSVRQDIVMPATVNAPSLEPLPEGLFMGKGSSCVWMDEGMTAGGPMGVERVRAHSTTFGTVRRGRDLVCTSVALIVCTGCELTAAVG